MIKKLLFNFLIVTSFLFLDIGSVFPQSKGESLPEIKLGGIRFQMREAGSTSSPVRTLEIQIEILNRSPKSTAPPHSIKVFVTPKEIKFSEGASVTELTLNPEEVSLDFALPPATGRVVMIGFVLPERKPESINFEIQINPPDGEKRTAKWEGSGN
jgi:hypothetical protein